MTMKMNNNPTNPNTATREQGLSGDSVDVDLSLGTLPAAAAARAAAAREEMQGEVENAVESETVVFEGNEIFNFQGNGVRSTQTIPVGLSPTPGGDSVPVTVIYGTNGSITFENGELAVAEGPETIAEVDIAGPSGRISYSGNLSNENDVLGRDAGESFETTFTYRRGVA